MSYEFIKITGNNGKESYIDHLRTTIKSDEIMFDRAQIAMEKASDIAEVKTIDLGRLIVLAKIAEKICKEELHILEQSADYDLADESEDIETINGSGLTL